MNQVRYVFIVLILLPSEVSGRENFSIDSSMAYDGGNRWQGYGIMNFRHFSIGAAGQMDPDSEFQGMIGINSALLTLGHLSDAGLAAEVRNPGYDALARLTERTFYHADLRSFSDSRIGIVFSPWQGRAGVGWERRPNLDTSLFWATPVSTDLWDMDLLWTAGLLNSAEVEDDWYPDEVHSSGGAFTTYAMKNRLEKGIWTGSLTSIVSAGVNIRPGFLIAAAMGLSTGPWKTRARGTWATEYFRNAEGQLPGIPVGVAWDGRLSPKTGLLLAAAFQLPLWTYHRSSTADDEACRIAIGWRFSSIEFLSDIEWNGLTHKPVPTKLTNTMAWEPGDTAIELKWYWDFVRNWKISLRWEWGVGKTFSIAAAMSIHRESVLLLDGHISLTMRYTRGKLILKGTVADIPRDWNAGPSSSGDLDIELRWIHDFVRAGQ